MNQTSWIAFHTLLQQSPPEKKELLYHFLSAEEKEQLERAPPAAKDPFQNPLSPSERLERIHYSWLIPFIEPLSEQDKLLILSAPKPVQGDKLREVFKIKDSLLSLSALGKNFLQNMLYHWVVGKEKDVLPVEFLPDSPLSPLLDLSKESLQMLIDFLGLHDLSIELKHLIKAELLKKIQKHLSKKERDYLKTLLKHKEPLFFAKLNVEEWDGDFEKLKIALHHRGLNRLSKALFDISPALFWHISHRLDSGRAKILVKFHTKIPDKKTHEILIQQILNIIPLIRSHV
ncbi:MAG: hypothetical protein HYZ47_03055 [Simkania negevensis]|nr:hypothetical protein [Simkania negevensis]